MIKTVFSSFFRTIGRIIAYLAFGALLALIFQNKDVFAIDYGYNKVDWSINSEGAYCTNDGYSIPLAGFSDFSGWKDLDVTIDLGECNTMGILTFRVYGNSTYTFKAGNSYTIRYTVDFEDAWEASMFMQNYEFGRLLTNTSNVQTGGVYGYENVTSYNSYMKEGSVENRVLIYFTFTPAVDLKFVRTYYYPKDLTPISNTNLYVDSDTLVKQSVMLNYVKVTYVEGSNAAIENQTNTIINQTDKINDSIDKFISIFTANSKKQESIYLDETENSDGTCGGILCNLKKVVKGVINLPQTFLTAIVDGLKALFIPSDFSFLDDFRNSIESKLGFIAEVPMAIIDFTLNLATASWEEFDSISFPEIEIFGYKFWNSQEIDLSEAIRIFAPFKYITDCLCVIICARTLNKWREKFTGGGD